MAFFRKASNILKLSVNKHINHEIAAANPSIFQMLRCMSSSKIFIGGLSYSTDDQSLMEAANKYGDVLEARVIVDRESGRSRGFGFVTYTAPEAASAAIQALDQRELHGRMVRVNYANDRSQGGGGYRGGGGSYGGGGFGGGGGGYGGGGYGGSGNYGGDHYAGESQNVGVAGGVGGSDGGGGSYGGGGYGGGGYGGGGGGYGGSGNYGGDNYASESQNVDVTGGVGGSNGYASGSPGSGIPSAAGGGYDGSTGTGFNNGDQFSGNGSSSAAEADGNFRDDEPGDYADRRA